MLSRMYRRGIEAALSFFLCLLPVYAAYGQTMSPELCPRPAYGSAITAPDELHSVNGSLSLTLSLQSDVDANGLVRYCFLTDSGSQSPTLRVNAGDTIVLHLKNGLKALSADAMAKMPGMVMPADSSGSGCGGETMSAVSTNLHFHGLNVPPTCHQDEVIFTLVNPGESFDYTIQIPADEPPGLYWYHPHPHGFSEAQVNGGATGAIIVEGIQAVAPALAGMPERTLVLRDQTIPAAAQVSSDPNEPSWDISLNYVPIAYPDYLPAVIETGAGVQEFWRVVNSAADTIFNIQILVGGVAESVAVYAIDGVPVAGGPLSQDTLFLPPGARVEFVVNTPAQGTTAQLVTTRWDAGPAGDSTPPRPIANIVPSSATPSAASTSRSGVARIAPVVDPNAPKRRLRFAGLASVAPSQERTLFFSEEGGDDPTQQGMFFITVAGQAVLPFNPANPANITTHAGTVEDWTIQNRSNEDHIFHMHQIHFQVLEVNGAAVSDPAIRDTMRVDHWSGTGSYPSIKVRMDFRDPSLVGTFVYHCHILGHEDRGMMGIIQVLPPAIATTTAITSVPSAPVLNSTTVFTGVVTPATSGGPAESGYVVFTVDGVGHPANVVAGQATYNAVFTSTGTHTVTASYTGDDNYFSSAAPPITINIPSPGFTLVTASPSLTLSGSAGSVAVMVNAISGFSSMVTLTCTLPATMTETTCSLTPSSVTGGGTSTLTIVPTAAHTIARAGEPPVRRRASWLSGVFAALALLPFSFGLRRRRNARWMCWCVAGALLCVASGCGNHTPPARTATDPGTPAGLYAVTVTGASGTTASALQSSVDVQVTVK